MFNYLYGGDLLRPNGTIGSVPLDGQLLSFDQSEFFENSGFFSMSASMDDQGYLYIPTGCSQNFSEILNLNPCKLAIALHGCAQTRLKILQVMRKYI